MASERFLSLLSQHVKPSSFLPSTNVARLVLTTSRVFKPHGQSFVRALSAKSILPVAPLKSDAKSTQSFGTNQFLKYFHSHTPLSDKGEKEKRYPRWAGYLLITSLKVSAKEAGGCWWAHRKPKTPLQAVLDLLAGDEPEKGFDLLLEQIQQTPKLHAALELLQQGKNTEAEFIFDRYFINQPDEYLYWIIKGISFREMEQPNQALDCFNKAIQVSPESIEAYRFKGALLLEDLSQHDDAISIFNQVLKLDPHDVSAHVNKGNALARKGDWGAAIASYDTALKLNPNDVAAHVKKGNALARKGDWDAAIVSFDTALKLNLNNGTLYVVKGCVLLEKGDWDAAIASSDAALKLDPNDVAAHVSKGSALAGKNDWDAAIASYDTALKLDPNDVAAHANKGDALRGKGNWDAAIASYDTALKLNPNDVAAHANKGDALAEKGDWDAAIASYDTALKLNPNHVAAHYNKGNTLAKKGNWDAALASYDTVLKLDSNDVAAHNNKGFARAKKGDWDAAIVSFDTALKLDPNHVITHSNKGNALVKKGDWDAAIASYDTALKLNPHHVIAHYNKGNALAKKGDWDAALASYDTVLKLSSNDVAAHNNKGSALAKKGDWDAALASYDTVLKLDPNHVTAHVNKGLALAGKGDLDAAIASYKQALTIDPKKDIAYFNLGACLFSLGKYDDGLPILQKAITLKGDPILANMAQEAINLLHLKRSKASSLFAPAGDRERRLLLEELEFERLVSHGDCAELSKAVYLVSANQPGKKLPSGWQQIACSLDGSYQKIFAKNGYVGAAYFHEATGHIVIAHRGTQLINPDALKDDKSITFAKMPVQFQQAWEFSEAIRRQYPGIQITYTGHSLGAALAELCAFESHVQGAQFPAVTFDSPGTRQIIQGRLAKRSEEFDPHLVDVTTYLATPNFINTLSPHIGLRLRIHAMPVVMTPNWGEWLSEKTRGLSYVLATKFPLWVMGAHATVAVWPHVKRILPDSIVGTVSVAGMGSDAIKETIKLCQHTFARHSIDHISAAFRPSR